MLLLSVFCSGVIMPHFRMIFLLSRFVAVPLEFSKSANLLIVFQIFHSYHCKGVARPCSASFVSSLPTMAGKQVHYHRNLIFQEQQAFSVGSRGVLNAG